MNNKLSVSLPLLLSAPRLVIPTRHQHITVSTIPDPVTHIRWALRVGSRGAAIVVAWQQGLLPQVT